MDEERLAFVVEAAAPAAGVKGLRGGGETALECREIPVERLREGLGRACAGLSQALTDLRQVGDFRLKRVTVAVEVSAEGGISFIGSAKAAGKGAITLTFEADS